MSFTTVTWLSIMKSRKTTVFCEQKENHFFQDFVKTENARATQPKYFVLTNITHFTEHKSSWKMSYIFLQCIWYNNMDYMEYVSCTPYNVVCINLCASACKERYVDEVIKFKLPFPLHTLITAL